MRYAGIKGNKITLISDKVFADADCHPIPDILSDISSKELIVFYRFRDGSFYRIDEKKPRKQIKLAIVSNFKQQCGISTYIESLLPHILPQVADVRLFIEEVKEPTSSIYESSGLILSKEAVVECWKRGERLDRLVKEIKQYNPDVIWFQHEYGLWSHAGRWLAMMTQLSSYRVIVTLHSVFRHADKAIVEASIPECIVHLDGARNVLKNDKKIGGIVHVVPHGCGLAQPGRLWNFYKSNETFIQQGFGFRYKRFETSIEATAILKEKYPNVFFTALFSKSPFNTIEHEMYRQELMDLIERLDLAENVAIVDGFQSEETIDSFLRTNRVAVFPYGMQVGHEVWGSSGASRVAMTTGMPVISSTIPHFSDMPTIKVETAEGMARELDRLFSNPAAAQQHVEVQNEWLRQNSWAEVAERHLRIFEG